MSECVYAYGRVYMRKYVSERVVENKNPVAEFEVILFGKVVAVVKPYSLAKVKFSNTMRMKQKTRRIIFQLYVCKSIFLWRIFWQNSRKVFV